MEDRLFCIIPFVLQGFKCYYSQFHVCDSSFLKPLRNTVNSRLVGHLTITDTPIKRTVAKSPAKANYRRLTEINPHYYGLSLKGTRTRGPYSVRY